MKFLSDFLLGLTPRMLLSIIMMALIPIFLIVALNVLFQLGIPINPLTYLCSLFLFWVTKPKIIMPMPMVQLSLGGMPALQMPPSKPKPHLHIVKTDDNEPPKAS